MYEVPSDHSAPPVERRESSFFCLGYLEWWFYITLTCGVVNISGLVVAILCVCVLVHFLLLLFPVPFLALFEASCRLGQADISTIDV